LTRVCINIHASTYTRRYMARVAVTDGMDPDAIRILKELGHDVIEQHYSKEELNSGILSEFDAVVVRSATKISPKIIASSGKLSFIGRGGVGVDNIDIDAATKAGIVVCNTPRSSTHSVVELTIGHLLASCRHIAKADRSLREGKWEKKTLKGTELSGKRLGLIGFGRIAQGVASIANSLGMECHTYDPYLPNEIASKFNTTLHSEINSLFRLCTHISVHCNLTEETYHLVNNERIKMMPGMGADGVFCGNHIVNCARGGIVDEKAILMNLESEKLSSAALDVFESEPVENNPLVSHPNFHGSPHVGAATAEAQYRIGQEMVTLLKSHFNGEKPHSALN